MISGLAFNPLLPPLWLALAGVVALAAAAAGVWARLPGRWLRALAVAAVWAALWSPSVGIAEREPARRTAVVVVDASGSMAAGDRLAAALAAGRAAGERLRALGFNVVEAEAGGRERTRLFAALDGALAGKPRREIAGALLVSDGQAHDAPTAAYPFPVHALIAGDRRARDAGVRVVAAPRSTPAGTPVRLRLAAEAAAGPLSATLSVDGRVVAAVTLPAEGSVEAVLPALSPGAHWIEAAITPPAGDLSRANDRAAVRVNALRPPLRVLLVTGAPYPGVRVWRAFLKSDPSVELVHFTILRTFQSADPTPTEEMALIEFPTRTLFIDRIDDFDLIVFDRFAETAILPDPLLASVAERVRRGGALLVVLGPEAGEGRGITAGPLASVLPVSPSGPAREGAFRPALTEAGRRHPVTAPLAAEAERWGPWQRYGPVRAESGDTLLAGPGGAPLLTLARAGRGRAAVMTSDQAWLWARGYDGGGPHGELLRRAAFWLMGEPELEEERLWAEADGERLRIYRRTLADAAAPAVTVAPSGARRSAPLRAVAPGLFEAVVPAGQPGLWRVEQDGRSAAAAVGGPRSLEQRTLASTDAVLRPVALASRGGSAWLADGQPELRAVRQGPLAGPGWFGFRSSAVWRTTGERRVPLSPPLLLAAALAGLLVLAWAREGR